MSTTEQTLIAQPNITFTIIKNDAVKNNVTDQIIAKLIVAGFLVIYRYEETIVKMSMAQTVKFYYEHIGRPYFPELIKCLADGCVPLILEHPFEDEPAFAKLRKLIGATKSRDAEPGTIRGDFGGHLFNPEAPVAENAIHGSDSLISVLNEIRIIFPELTEINSFVYGEFALDQFQVGTPEIAKKIKILGSDYADFNLKYQNNELPKQKLGRAFYDYFKLYESILKDDSRLVELCNKDGVDAINFIDTIVEFI